MKRNAICIKNVIKVVSTMILCGVIIFESSSVNAASGSATKNMKGSYSRTSYSCSMYWENNFWDTEFHAKGSAKTFWYGMNPLRADSIVHKDILSCTGVGSMSIGANSSGGNIGSSISGGDTATFSYSQQNTYCVSTNYHYYTTGLMAGWAQKMRTSATVQFGGSFYSFSS